MLTRLLCSGIALGVGCGGGITASEPVQGGSRAILGQVVDFKTGAAVDAGTSVSVSGLLAAPRITAQGAAFTIEGVPDHSVFQVLAAATGHRPTFSPTISVTDFDLDGIKVATVDDAYLSALATAFGVTPAATKGVVFVHLVDGKGTPRAGVAASSLALVGAGAPRFLDAAMQPVAAASASLASGWAVYFDVPAGLATVSASATATVTVEMAASPVAAGSVTLAEAKVVDGTAALPTNVSFAGQIAPIFVNRGCVACHAGNGPGKDIGNLTLSGGSNLVYRELTQETTTRVNLATPEASRVLTMPSRETPPDNHPNVTFASAQDPDFRKILVWIREGAKNN